MVTKIEWKKIKNFEYSNSEYLEEWFCKKNERMSVHIKIGKKLDFLSFKKEKNNESFIYAEHLKKKSKDYTDDN